MTYSLPYEEKIEILVLAFKNSILPGLAVLIIVASACGIGVFILKAFRPKDQSQSPLELPLGIALGLGVIGYFSDIFFMLQFGRMPIVLVLFIVLGLICLCFSLKYIGSILSPKSNDIIEMPNKFNLILVLLGWCVVEIVLVKHYINTSVPISDNDSIVHYAFLSRMIAEGITFDQTLLLRKMPITDLNRVIPMIYALSHVLMGEGSMHLMNFIFFTTTLMLIQFFSVYQLRIIPLWNPLPILISLNIFEIICTGYSAKVDYGVAMLEVACILALITRKSRSFWILPIFFGLSISARINSVKLIPIFLIIMFVDIYIQHSSRCGFTGFRRITFPLRKVAITGSLAAFIGAPPYFMNALIYGNPFFPFLNKLFGDYQHWYDYVLFKNQRYYVQGLIGPFLVYLQLCIIRVHKFLECGGSLGGNYGLSPIFLLAPFSIIKIRGRELIILYAFFVLGFISWYLSAHTHRTLLGITFVGVILLVDFITKLRTWKVLYYGIFSYLILVALSTLPVHLETNYLAYFLGKIDKNQFYEDQIRKENHTMLTPSIHDAKEIKAIVGDESVLSVNVVMQANPEFINIMLIYVRNRDMMSRLQSGDLDELDRNIIEGTISNSYLREEYKRFARIVFGEGNSLAMGHSRRDLWDFVKTYYDVHYFIQDALIKEPKLVKNLMKAQNINYLVVPTGLIKSKELLIAGLKIIWQSQEIELFEREEIRNQNSEP